MQGIADAWIDVMNEHIKELVNLNFNGVENYPKLTVTDIGSISMDEQMGAISTALSSGVLDITQDDKQMIRDILKMPRLTQSQIKEVEKASEQKAIDDKKTLDKQDEMKKEDPKKKDKNLSDIVKPTPREVKFTKNITSFEQYLNKKFTECEKIVKEAEKEYQEVVTKLYEESDSQRIDGVVCLVYDKSKITKGKNQVQKITDRLQAKLIDSDLQDKIFKEAIAKAKTTLEDNEKYLASWTMEIKRGQIDSFIEGYKSNMQGVIYNESRRVLENITLNYGSEASLDLAKKTASEITINKNILSLSFITHPRALYKFAVYTEAQAEGFTMFKTLVPTDKIPNVIDRPFGMTASLVFTIQTASQINQTASALTAGKTAEAVTGL